MDKVGQKLVRNLKSRKYEVMDGINSVDRVETLQIGRFSPDAYSQHNTSHPHGDDPNHNGGDGSQKSYRELGNDIEMTASVSGVVPDDTFTVAQAINALGFGKFQVMLSLFTGLCWMADSMEMMILSILSPALHCEWGINEYKQAFLTTAVFFGMMVSSPFWGDLSDKYGRRLALWVSVGLLFFYGTVSSFSPGYLWLVFLRCFVGFAIGCVPQSVTLYAEFLPTKQRARCVILLDCFWALGACLEVLLALVVMPTLGWRWLLGLSALPIFIFFIMCYWLPESVRFLAASGETEKALSTLKRIAKDNGRPMLLGRLVVDDMQQTERGRMKDLLMPEMRKTTLLLWFIWMTCAFCYYGVVLLSTEILGDTPRHRSLTSSPTITMFGNSSSSSTTLSPLALSLVQGNGTSIMSECKNPDHKMLTQSDYIDLLWTTLAEFPGILITIFVLDKIGRKNTMAAQFVLFALTIFMFCFPIEDRVVKTIILFAARGIVSGVFQAAYVYTPEVYPTSMRSIGIGTCSSMARIGAMVTPYVAQVIYKQSVALAAGVYGVIALMAAVVAIMLPIETKGKEMPDRVPKS
ncbi:synaptic vesicle 2-related protein [Folsomia candida]|uniref:Synaptic vesicle 2-related protein n=1 Tax=Folsomia candida TaxID=158441 RepID=A0A226EUC0_FOLCA|nr:synaptic vesicle 2-related protein [Folsomia candida]OXA60411.1 Synaptic vesicle 2-related protein [Folsomia candida]